MKKYEVRSGPPRKQERPALVEEVEMEEPAMRVTTTPPVAGRPVKEYRGIVTGEAIVRGTVGDFAAALASAASSRDPLHERYLVEARDAALKKLTVRAEELGANAVVGVHLDYEQLHQSVMVAASGTAVVIQAP